MSLALSKRQIINICFRSEREARAQVFIETLAREMSTEVFIDFMIALEETPHVRQEIFKTYKAEGGTQFTPSKPSC